MADDGLDINFIFLSENSKNVMVFQMTADEFASKTKNDLTFLPDVQKETLTDLQESGKKFYLIPKKNNWKLLEGVENLSEQEAEAFMEKLCREGIATLFPNKDEIEEYRRQIIPARDAENKKQAELRVKYNFVPPQFVAHATHVSQAEFKTSAGKIFAQYPENTDLVPAFSKGTQNEFNAEKNINRSFDVDKLMALGQLTPYLERVFAIATKQDDSGNPIFDAQGRPVPQDGSYAYSLKKCCASINTVDGETPLLIGFEDKYADFESGKKIGHIYIGRGDNFKAEYDERGNITEYTSNKEMVVTYEYKTTPKDAMEHNVQLVMFKTENGYDKWAAEVKSKRDKFASFISSDDIMIKLLQEEIVAGRATYINATERGFNPKIEILQKAQENANQANKLNNSKTNRSEAKMNSNDFEDLISFSEIAVNPENGSICFTAYKGKETDVAELIQKNQLENLSMEKFSEFASQYMPIIQAKKKIREKKINNFKNLPSENVAQLSLEQRVDYLETIFHRHQTMGEMSDICSHNKDKLKALLFGIKLPKDFWESEEQQANRFVALVADNKKITDNMKNWHNISIEDKKATLKETAKIIRYVYDTPLEIGFYTPEEYRKENNLDENAPVFGAYQERGKIFFNTDRLENSDNYMGVSVLFHEFTHKRQEETEFANPLINRLFACKVDNAVGYEMKNINSSSPEYGDIYSLMPKEMHAHAMQKYVEDNIANKTGIKKTQVQEAKDVKQVHDKSFAMAEILRSRSND